jgi:hypothetical protein
MKHETRNKDEVQLRKTRKCLRCRDTFDSEWAGERICPRCKSSQAWKSGSYERPFA